MDSVEPHSQAEGPRESPQIAGLDSSRSPSSSEPVQAGIPDSRKDGSSSSASSMATSVAGGSTVREEVQDQEYKAQGQGSPNSEVPPRKRSKVSRACDECRRKKIRCDALLDHTNTHVTKMCSNCEKSGDVCLFTRVPMKRGPSKGYTKLSGDNGNQSASKTSPRLRTPSHGSYPQLQGIGQQQLSPGQQHAPLFSPNSSSGSGTPAYQASQSPQVILPPLNPHILPPLRGRSSSLTSAGQTTRQQPMFWKVPYEMPAFEGRRDSIDSISSSISGSFPLSARPSIQGNSPKLAPSFGLDNLPTSDSEDEFLNNNSSRLARPSFQVPLVSTRSKEGTVSPVPSHNSLQSLNQNFSRLAIPAPQFKTAHLLKSIDHNLDVYFSKLHAQYPILTEKGQIQESLEQLQTDEYATVLELFNYSLQVLNSVDANFDFNVIVSSFQQISLIYASKSFINNNVHAKTLFLLTFVLLNYTVILSGHEYSIGFTISFSIFNDWKIYKEPSSSPLFRAFMHLVVLDNIFALSFGTPRNTSLAFNQSYLHEYAKSLKASESESLEYVTVGLNLLLLPPTDPTTSIPRESKLYLLNDKYKFLSILEAESDICCLIRNFSSSLENLRTTEADDFVFDLQLEFSKLCKRLIYLIDEQVDDLELLKIQPLLPLYVLKCFKILLSLKSLISSLISFNITISNDDFKDRLAKLIDTIDANMERLRHLRTTIPFLKVLISSLKIRTAETLLLPALTEKLPLLQNWCRQSSSLLHSTLTRDYFEGWYS
ncbi:hypothetical protein KL939_001592 [Ogataea angusta]|nr:hypothetical protein KL939_001592 [Ogataea angusta]